MSPRHKPHRRSQGTLEQQDRVLGLMGVKPILNREQTGKNLLSYTQPTWLGERERRFAMYLDPIVLFGLAALISAFASLVWAVRRRA
ncbi:hypothetical protein U8326_00340 [Tsuneonella sp. CC-YZS046]|uniref:hypothetical protein n=1 Tax=Tsuneonella sp. CC-YZS046 TaxID=3042152 RepID=UPI002D79EEB3|nr:hypothetical protein [Tsuneonella sp. CC-YZS046]WRO66651.1 hypothetical protein U8326_00340 [Tsuneonella sp. CC-YZS046]